MQRRTVSWLLMGAITAGGCTSAPIQPPRQQVQALHAPAAREVAAPQPSESTIQQVAHLQELYAPTEPALEEVPRGSEVSLADLIELETLAAANNPALWRLSQEAAAAWAKVGYQKKLPDPTVGGNVFAQPIETAAGPQRANLAIMQMIPWLSRLEAQAQQASYEAMALDNLYAGERLRIIGDVRANWYRLYVLRKQIETTQANQTLLTTLIEIANARVATGKATQGDVLLGTLEYSTLEEQLIDYRQQVVATQAELNRLVGRDAESPIAIPDALYAALPDWNHDFLRQVAFENQPAIGAARLQAAATRWGVEVARLKRRPDVSVNANWFVIEDGRRLPSPFFDIGQDAWSVGATMSVPLWHKSYDAMTTEATRKHFAAHASEEEIALRIDARLRELWEQARAANDIARLYERTILPQARQTLEADQQSLVNDAVEFDRVIGDFRTLLTLQLGYHRAIGQLATALARIEQTVGLDLLSPPVAPGP